MSDLEVKSFFRIKKDHIVLQQKDCKYFEIERVGDYSSRDAIKLPVGFHEIPNLISALMRAMEIGQAQVRE